LTGISHVRNPAVPPPRRPSRLWGNRQLIAVLVTGAAYYAGARIGLLPALVRGQVTPFWPPTGIAVACMMLFGLRCWPGIAIASFAVNAPLGPSLLAVIGIAAGNTLAPLAAVVLMRVLRVSRDLARLRDALLFVFAGVSSTLISASCGTAMLRAFGGIRSDQVWSTGSVWWAGDAMGVLVVAPVILQLTRARELFAMTALRLAEGVVVLGLVGAVMGYYINTSSPTVLLICPLLVWSAVRFRQAGAALVALEVSIIASAAAAADQTAFAEHTVVRSMLILLVFNASVALSGLLLATVISALHESGRDLALANLLLSHRVEQHDVELNRDRSRLAVLADRHRIATQLQDTVLQRLFGIGAALEAAAAASGPENHERLARLVDELDTTVNDLALAIYQVEEDGPGTTFGDAVEHVVNAAAASLPVRPAIRVIGDVERIPLAQRTQLLAALQDLLSDLGEAGSISVTLSVTGAEVALSVVADDIGAQSRVPGRGVARAHARALRLSGRCEWRTGDNRSIVDLRIPTP
jgi:integral membrane sensor domain MASE1